jgi:hypothetical protein|nr:MAG TPA: hypothetical protein [Caudoviricetes sp.]
MARRISYSDNNSRFKENPSRGYIKDGIYHIWACYISEGESSGVSFTSEELAKVIKNAPNPRYALFKFMERLDYANTERWIENSPPRLREKRRDWWENDTEYGRGSAGAELAVDSMVSVVVNLYKKLTGLDIYETRANPIQHGYADNRQNTISSSM